MARVSGSSRLFNISSTRVRNELPPHPPVNHPEKYGQASRVTKNDRDVKMSTENNYKWEFSSRFRRGCFGWRSEPAITRIKEAVAEISKVARKDQILGAMGAVLFLEKLSPALERVDSSSGAIGTAVNNAIEKLTPVIAKAPADDKLRLRWLERLWEAVREDDIPYIEQLTVQWGELCGTSRTASIWADQLINLVRMSWSSDPELRGYFKGTPACFSALFKADRNGEILDLLKLAPYKSWHYRRWGVKALSAMGKKDEALQYAEGSRGINESPSEIARACEEILLSDGLIEEAYRRYAIEANRKTTNLATFRAIAQKYPDKNPREILIDLATNSPGEEGKWFAAAKSAGLYLEALELANSSPCDPKTLTRAARDMAESEPHFAIEAGMTALKWLVAGYGYEVTSDDVRSAYSHTMKAAETARCQPETFERIRTLVAGETSGERFVTRILGQTLGLNQRV